jgi:hypothetical protein
MIKASDITIIYPPCRKNLNELLEEFRNLDKEDIYETINILRIIRGRDSTQ